MASLPNAADHAVTHPQVEHLPQTGMLMPISGDRSASSAIRRCFVETLLEPELSDVLPSSGSMI